MSEGKIDFNLFLDNDGNTLLHALANPEEAKCTDGLKLMETVQFLCHRNLDFKVKNRHGKSFLDLVTDKNARPVVKKYIAHDFVAELEHEERRSSTDSIGKCPDIGCKTSAGETP